MQLTTPIQKQLLCVLLGLLVGAVAVGLFFSGKIADLERVHAREHASKQGETVALNPSEAGEVEKPTKATKLPTFPVHISAFLKSLSGWGYWAPGKTSFENGQFNMASARYKGESPTRHSYRRLESVGALEKSAKGCLTLYAILATEADRERGRKLGGGIEIAVDAGVSSLAVGSGDLETVFTTSDAARKTLGQIQELQSILITHRDDLIADGVLAK